MSKKINGLRAIMSKKDDSSTKRTRSVFPAQAALLAGLRARHDFTQEQLAKILRYKGTGGTQLVSNIERGICGIPPQRLKYLKNYISVTEALKAYLSDVEQMWLSEVYK